MTHTFIHFRSALSFREARLCFQNNTLGGNPDLTPRAPESPVPPTARPPEGPTKDIADKQRIEKDKLAKERKMTVQETQLRTKLLALQVQVDAVNKQIGAKKQNAAAMKTGLEQERTKLDAVGVAVQQLRDSDPQGLAALELEMGVSFTQIQDILRANPSDPNSVRMRQDLIGALGRVSTFTGPELNLSADDVMENIRTFTVGIADSDFVRGGIEQLRNLTRGKINPSQEKVAQMIFQLIRGTVANFLATASLPELLRQFVGPEIEQQARAIGKELNWRLALEAYWKTEAGRKVAARNGRPNRPTFTDMATMSTDQVQALVLPSPLVKEYWDENYGKWSLFAQEQKARKQKITVPMPKIEDGETENAKKQYQDRLVKAQLTPIPVTAPTETPRTQIIGTLDFGTTGKVEVTPEGRPIDVASKRVTFKKEGNIYTMSFPEGNGMRRIELVDAFSTTGQRGNFNKIELSNRGATDAALVKVVFNGGTEADGMTLGALVAEAINRPGKPKAVFASRTAVTFE